MWPRTYHAAVRLQERLRGQLKLSGGPRRVRLVAGADLSCAKGSDRLFAAVVVVAFPSLDLVEEVGAAGTSPFPYIPGLLSFREGPLLLRAFRKLACRPDLLFFDGHGIAHPRGLGIAAHLGLLLDTPSLGCGKTRLVGEHAEPGEAAGSVTPLRFQGRRVGTVVRTKTRTKPLFVSPGHLLGHAAAVRWALRLCDGYRLPVPVRLAHLASNALRLRC
ncbi:MAG: endonuclease V [Planctomycetaceae bacterium]